MHKIEKTITLRFSKLSIFFVFGTILLISGCSTTNHAPLLSMAYSDLTSHYNAYFNAKERLNTVVKSVETAHKDNFKEVLPLFAYSNVAECASYKGELDEVDKHCTESVQIHKTSNFNDDHFLLMGKANYLKGDYDKAQNFLKYLTTEFKEGVDYVKEMKKQGKSAKPNKKKKPVKKPQFKQVLDSKGNSVLQKVDERPSYSPFIHEPARAEALLWLAKTYSATGKYAEAASVIQFARADDKFYKNLDKELELTDAENLLRQKEYRNAIEPLEKFLTMTKKKSARVRPLFILAQIYELQNNYAKAADYYKQVLKSRPNYDMEFYSKIRRANLGRKSGNSQEVKSLLVKMSRDGKYKDYLDQIYYELGEIYLSENNRAEARKDFHKSVDNSFKNPDQKALSYLRLAKLDYEEELYVTAKFYYDSTLQNFPKNDPEYAALEKRDKVLERLVAQLTIIKEEDSLQRVANLSKPERDKLIKKMINDKEKAEEKKQQEKESGKSSSNSDFVKTQQNPNPLNIQNNNGDEPSWYFYNPLLKNTGYTDFVKRWGRRNLEDNWRRKDKTSTIADANAASDTAKASTDADVKDAPAGTEEQKYLDNLPMTSEKKEKSNGKLVDAYYELGTVYKDGLENYRKATITFEEMNKRFGKHKLQLESYYQLYLLATKAKNTAKADDYKSRILAEYPNSVIAKYIQDPNFLAEAKKKENALDDYYASAYNDYSTGKLAEADQKCLQSSVEFKDNKLQPKFDLLRVLILGKQNRLDDYVQGLNKFISKYTGTPEKEMAQRLLADLNHSKLPMVDISKDTSHAAALALDTTPKPVLVQMNSTPINDFKRPTFNISNLDSISKAAAKDTAKAEVKPYKPLSKTERMDSIIKAEKAAKYKKPTETVSEPIVKTEPTVVSKDTSNAKPYKPLSKTERMDSIMKAEKAAKYKPAPKPIEAPKVESKPFAKDTTNAKPYKPLSKTERMDSIMKAEKNLKNKPQPVVVEKPIASKDTVATKKTEVVKAAPKDTVKKVVKPEVKPKVVVKDTVVTKPKVVAKDTVAKEVETPKPVVLSLPTFDTDTITEVYGLSDAAPHNVVLYFKDPSVFNSSLVTKLDAFNEAGFATSKLTARGVVLDNNNKLFCIKSFKNKADAMEYLAALKAKPEVLADLKERQYHLVAVSSLNYSTLISTKKINNYLHFYRANYK